jgi:branched-subunit amino acid transport protein
MSPWIVILSIALGTYLLRVSMFLLVGRRRLPDWMSSSIPLVSPAAIAALVAAMACTRAGRIDPLPAGQLLAIAASFLVVRRTGNVSHAFAVGFPIACLMMLVR